MEDDLLDWLQLVFQFDIRRALGIAETEMILRRICFCAPRRQAGEGELVFRLTKHRDIVLERRPASTAGFWQSWGG